MTQSLALVVCFVGIGGLCYLNRDNTVRSSGALWLPVIWLWIVGSRPISVWLGGGADNQSLTQQLEGSPVDRLVFQIVLVIGLAVLTRRGRRVLSGLRGSWPIVMYFAYGLTSVLWADFPDVTFKRWIKAIGDLVMVLIVVTDAKPVAAVGRLLSRAGFLLLPLSICFIKYMPTGRGYDPDGLPMNTGVTTNKNTLGVVTCVLTVGALWRFVMLIRAKHYPNRGRQLLAQGTLLAFGVTLLAMAHSATSVATFGAAAAMLVVTSVPAIRKNRAAVHVVVLIMALLGALVLLLGGQGLVTHALGRGENLTGRTEIWAAVLRGVDSPLLGAGFESFWLGPRLLRVWSGLSGYMHVNEAHNGYLEMYLNLGWLGVGLLVMALGTAYRHSVAAFRRNPEIGSLMLAYVIAAAIYSCTEAGFRMLNPIWIFFLLGGSRSTQFGGRH